MDDVLPRWVRIGLVVLLGIPQLATGLWAVLAPESWFDSFPGFDPRVVAADPPYNAHLATDAGAGFLATGVGLLLAALWARRQPAVLALVTFLVLAVPHALFHTFSPAASLSTAEQVLSAASLWFGVAAAGLLVVGATRTDPVRGRLVTSTSSPT
jgi:hypothetical protein